MPVGVYYQSDPQHSVPARFIYQGVEASGQSCPYDCTWLRIPGNQFRLR
jgi:hypothetical protein